MSAMYSARGGIPPASRLAREVTKLLKTGISVSQSRATGTGFCALAHAVARTSVKHASHHRPTDLRGPAAPGGRCEMHKEAVGIPPIQLREGQCADLLALGSCAKPHGGCRAPIHKRRQA